MKIVKIRCAILVVMGFAACSMQGKLKVKKEPVDMRAAYIQKVQQTSLSNPAERSPGSLWVPGAPLAEIATDFKARRLNDTIIIQVIEQTSAQTNGNAQQNRSVTVNSGITGLGGHVSVGGVNPILNASSSQQMKGNGQVEADSKLSTSLTGQVVSVLPNGNLVVEAQRSYTINGQHDTVVVRGVARPGDINSGNSIFSTQLMNLEVELKGKGLVADGTRSPNVITRTLMWLLGF